MKLFLSPLSGARIGVLATETRPIVSPVNERLQEC
ncbi:hypothetical protein CDEF62S_04367 [Castellaniella defragrans]